MLVIIRKYLCALKRRLIWIMCRLLPIDSKKILVCNYAGRGYGDNPKYIVEELLNTEKRFKIVWLISNEKEKDTLPNGVLPCKLYSTKSIYHLMTSKIWIDNCRKPVIMPKRKKQYYIQTWHGFALKRIEKDAEEALSKLYVDLAKKDSKNIDCIISCSSFMSTIYSNSFWYNGYVWEIGAPRNDILLNRNYSVLEKVYKYFSLDTNKKIVLYAPTFRNNEDMSVYSIDYNRVKKACEKQFGGEFAVITRLHPNIAAKADFIKYDGINMINGTLYPDLQELMLASEVVITDYSSLMFDFALTEKPCFQFATDIEDYKKDRNFYFEIDKLPFPLAKNNDELENNILNFDNEKYKNTLDDFYNKVGMIREGNASKKCAEIIIDKCCGGRN